MQQALQESDFREPIEKVQPMNSEATVIAVAKQNLDDYNRILNFGVGVSKSIGATSIDGSKDGAFGKLIDDVRSGDLKGPFVLMAPLKTNGAKGLARAREKVKNKYDGNWGKLTDVVRGTIAVDSFQDIPATVKALRKHAAGKGWKITTRPNDRFSNPTNAGYRDLQLSIESPDGLQAEVQINTKAMWLAKETKGHKLFEEYRPLEEHLNKHGPDPVKEKRREELEKQMKELYQSAHEASGGDKALNSKRRSRKRKKVAA